MQANNFIKRISATLFSSHMLDLRKNRSKKTLKHLLNFLNE